MNSDDVNHDDDDVVATSVADGCIEAIRAADDVRRVFAVRDYCTCDDDTDTACPLHDADEAPLLEMLHDAPIPIDVDG